MDIASVKPRLASAEVGLSLRTMQARARPRDLRRQHHVLAYRHEK